MLKKLLKKQRLHKQLPSQYKLKPIPYILLIILISLGSAVKADEYYPELSGSLGISNVSFAETESKVENSNIPVEAQSGSISVLSVDLNYKFYNGETIDYYTRLSAPFLSASGDNYFSISVGGSYYFGTQSAKTELNENGSTIKYTPKLRYFAGVELGVGFLVFSNELVKRNDTLFNIGFHGGASYTISENWAVRGSLHFARGTGTSTATTVIQFFGGMTYFFGK